MAENIQELESEEEVFGALLVSSSKVQLNALVEIIDQLLLSFSNEEYYKERIFHCSICKWGKKKNEDLSQELPRPSESESELVKVTFQIHKVACVEFKAGHLTFNIPLDD